VVLIDIIDKILLSLGGAIDGLFLPVQGYFAFEKQGWRCGLERMVEDRAHLQTYPFTPQFSFAYSLNSESVMPGCIGRTSIQGPDRDDGH